jgi:hypothetical protein
MRVNLILLVMLLAILSPFIGMFVIDAQACHIKGQSFDDSEYHFIGGCMVEHEGKWLPLENIRGFN